MLMQGKNFDLAIYSVILVDRYSSRTPLIHTRTHVIPRRTSRARVSHAFTPIMSPDPLATP